MTAIQPAPTSLWQVFHESTIGERERGAFLREALKIVADLATKICRNSNVPTGDASSLEIVAHAILHISIPSSSFRDFRGVFRHLCGHVQGMHNVLVFLASSPPVREEWTFEHVAERMSVIYYTYLDDEGAMLEVKPSESSVSQNSYFAFGSSKGIFGGVHSRS